MIKQERTQVSSRDFKWGLPCVCAVLRQVQGELINARTSQNKHQRGLVDFAFSLFSTGALSNGWRINSEIVHRYFRSQLHFVISNKITLGFWSQINIQTRITWIWMFSHSAASNTVTVTAKSGTIRKPHTARPSIAICREFTHRAV